MSIQSLQDLVKTELQKVDSLMQQVTCAAIPLVNEVCTYILSSGGKRIRPLVVLLSGKCFNYHQDPLIQLATVIEFFHTSSLLHDDVVDSATLRRGQEAAHQIWGNKASVLIGDFLFSKAFQLLVGVKNQTISSILADTANLITQGEVQQLVQSHQMNLTKAMYLEIIHSKTASLFQASAQMGPVLANRHPEEIKAMSLYGLHLGNAFQMVDDILDYSGSSENLGKAIGNDLAEGKITLPLLHVLEKGTESQRQLVQQTLQKRQSENFQNILQAIHETQAITYAHQCAEEEVDRAITHLLLIEPSEYRDALETLAQFTLNRAT